MKECSNNFTQVAIPSEEVIKKMGALVKEMEVNSITKIFISQMVNQL